MVGVHLITAGDLPGIVGLREIAAEFNLSNKSVVSAYENGRSPFI